MEIEGIRILGLASVSGCVWKAMKGSVDGARCVRATGSQEQARARLYEAFPVMGKSLAFIQNTMGSL